MTEKPDIQPASVADTDLPTRQLISDERLLEATGRTRKQWFKALDKAGAQDWDHKRIARWLGGKHEVDGWWAQSVTVDYEYARNGTTNLFVAVEPKAGQRTVSVTERRGKADFVVFVGDLLTHTYAKARRVHLVLDNLNIHFRRCFDDVLGKRAANKLLRRVQFHYTPKHASWLNMAEIEIGILTRQCLDRRTASQEHLKAEVAAWQLDRNKEARTIDWKFTRQHADEKLSRHYV